MIKRLFYIIIFLLIAVPVKAATYNYYFATGEGAGTCLIGDPCSTLAHAQAKVDAATSSDIVNLYFNKGNTWSENTAAVGNPTQATYGLLVGIGDPAVNINAYGSGADPIFDGLVTDFSSTPSSGSPGPYHYNTFFRFEVNDCSVSNVEIKQVYGNAIIIGHNATPLTIDNFTLSDSNVHHFGSGATKLADAVTIINSTYENNLIHTGQQLKRYNKRSGWGPALDFLNDNLSTGNLIRYNVVYDIYGEGIDNHNGITEYNIIGDTYSVAIYAVPHKSAGGAHGIIRYNFIIKSSSNTYGATQPGISILDEDEGVGTNENFELQVYGNIIINRSIGIKLRCDSDMCGSDGNLATVKIFNNTIIDSSAWNFYVTTDEDQYFDNVYIYNNSSIFYDRTEKHVNNTSNHGGWVIDNNHYWVTGGSPTVDNEWDTNYVTTDPKLYGEEKGSPENWDGQAAGDPRGNITFADCYPNISSSLVGAGKTLATYEKTFLTLGTDFSVLPGTVTFATSEQTDLVAYDIGPAIRSLSYDFNVNDGDTDVNVDVVLSWTNQGDTTGVDGYFDAGSCPIGAPTKVVDDNLQATYDPTLVVNTTYCYTVDPHNSNSETEAGKDLEFTTSGGPPPPQIGKHNVLYSPNAGDVLYSPNAGDWK